MKISFLEARARVQNAAERVSTEIVPLGQAMGRVLAQNIAAPADVPPFDRSPYDGYALRGSDVQNASRENPVTLRILEEIPAGGVSHCPVTPGTAVKILTGAVIPEGADCVVMFEKTEFTDCTVTLFQPLQSGENIVRRGEDIRQGEVLAEAGQVIDMGLLGTLAAQNVQNPRVYRRPVVGVISTGSELVPVGEALPSGKIYDSNQYSLSGALEQLGCEPVRYGIVEDQPERIRDTLAKALEECDAVILTGGVSVGDYDHTPNAMEQAGVEILFRGVEMKPGMACAYGVKDGKLVCGLSGNPASSITNFYAVAAPALKKLAGRRNFEDQEITVTLKNGFGKKSPITRLLRGVLDLSDGTVRMAVPGDQGNVVLSSTIGCDVMAVVPAGSGPVEAGTVLKGFLL